MSMSKVLYPWIEGPYVDLPSNLEGCPKDFIFYKLPKNYVCFLDCPRKINILNMLPKTQTKHCYSLKYLLKMR